jgi:hypothetical protein
MVLLTCLNRWRVLNEIFNILFGSRVCCVAILTDSIPLCCDILIFACIDGNIYAKIVVLR